MKLIDKDAAVAEIEKRRNICKKVVLDLRTEENKDYYQGKAEAYKEALDFLNTIEVKGVDLEKLGEIARHLIAVKEHIEDMRLDKEEWFMLETIGYPERFKAQKGE